MHFRFHSSVEAAEAVKAATEPDLVRYKGLIMTMALCNTSKTFMNAQPKATMARFWAESILIGDAIYWTEKMDLRENVIQIRLNRFLNLPQ